MKIAVDVSLDGGSHRGTRFRLPKIDAMHVLDLAEEGARGSDELNRILQMERVR